MLKVINTYDELLATIKEYSASGDMFVPRLNALTQIAMEYQKVLEGKSPSTLDMMEYDYAYAYKQQINLSNTMNIYKITASGTSIVDGTVVCGELYGQKIQPVGTDELVEVYPKSISLAWLNGSTNFYRIGSLTDIVMDYEGVN